MDITRLWNALRAHPLLLDETSQPLEIDRAGLEKFYLPLAQEIIQRAPAAERLLVVVAGPPGSGKSAFAALLAVVINLIASAETAVVVGLDGWHLPNAYLDSHTIEWNGETAVLRSLKGAPETYASASLTDFLKSAAAGAELRFPVYSRALHDPIPDAGIIASHHRIINLEGNYWLLNEPPWNALNPRFDLRIFLRAEPSALLDGLRQRHLRGGKSPQFTEAHLQRVDLPNIRRVLDHSLPADVIVQKIDSRRIAGIQRRSVQDKL